MSTKWKLGKGKEEGKNHQKKYVEERNGGIESPAEDRRKLKELVGRWKE